MYCVCALYVLNLDDNNMVKPKKSKIQQQKEAAPVPHNEEEAEESCQSDPEVDNEWLQKYMGENQMTWFRKIIRAQATDIMKNIIAQEVQHHMKDMIANVRRENETAIKESNNMIEVLKADNDKKRRRIDKLEFLLHKKDDKINELLVKVDNIEQKEFESDVQLVGVEETKTENDELKNLLKLSKEKLGEKLKPADIKSVHRLGKRRANKNRDLVVSFKDPNTRERVYRNRKKLSGNRNPAQNIYINDRITHYRQGLFFQARKLCKAKKVFAAWTQKGNVLVRKSEGGPVVEIHSYKDLSNIIENQMSVNSSSLSSLTITNEEMLSHLSDYDYDSDFV